VGVAAGVFEVGAVAAAVVAAGVGVTGAGVAEPVAAGVGVTGAGVAEPVAAGGGGGEGGGESGILVLSAEEGTGHQNRPTRGSVCQVFVWYYF